MKKNIFFSNVQEIGITHQAVEKNQKFGRGSKVDEISNIKDIAKTVREYVKKKYPNYKFSVTIERYSGGQSMTVSLLEADFDPLVNDSYWREGSDNGKYYDVNQYYIDTSEALTPKAKEVIKDVRNFYNQYNYDHSDAMTDYFNKRFYETITIGRWDKGFVKVASKGKTPKTPKPMPEKGGSEAKYKIGQKVTYKTSKGSESGIIQTMKFIATKQTYLYFVKNPRGGVYSIFESNILSVEDTPETPETPTPETPKLLASVTAFSFKPNGEKVTRTEDIFTDNILFKLDKTANDIKDTYESFWKGKVTVTKVVMNGEEVVFVKDETPETPTKFTPEILERLRMYEDGDPNSEIGSVPLLQDKDGEYWYVRSVNEEKATAEIINATDNRQGIALTPANIQILDDFQVLRYLPNASKKLKKIVIAWSELEDYQEGETFYTWKDFQDKAKTIVVSEGGYYKTKLFILWENNRFLIDRVDFGVMEGDFNPNIDYIGDYIGNQSGAFYRSNFTSGKRKEEALWKDTEEVPETPTPEKPQPETKYRVGDVFRRSLEGEEPPNTKITYTILSIGEEKTQYRIDYLDEGRNRLSTKSNEKITEEITSGWWVKYELSESSPNDSLSEAIELLRDENDLLNEMSMNSTDTELRREARLSQNENSMAINDFSADLFFNPEKFMNEYFDRATKKHSYDNSELTEAEFNQITNTPEFINWFGDFRKPLTEKNLVSKVVKLSTDLDDMRQPLVVYHGTWNKTHFSRFKFKKFPVIYFASNKSYAEWFAKMGSGIIYQCFLDIKNLCDFRDLGLESVSWSELSDYLLKKYGFSLPIRDTRGATLPAWAWIRNDAPQLLLINTIKEQGFTGMRHIEDNPQDILPNGEKNTTTAYMIFSPEQAKLVRYVGSSNVFTDIFFMKRGGKIYNKRLHEKIKNFKFDL